MKSSIYLFFLSISKGIPSSLAFLKKERKKKEGGRKARVGPNLILSSGQHPHFYYSIGGKGGRKKKERKVRRDDPLFPVIAPEIEKEREKGHPPSPFFLLTGESCYLPRAHSREEEKRGPLAPLSVLRPKASSSDRGDRGRKEGKSATRRDGSPIVREREKRGQQMRSGTAFPARHRRKRREGGEGKRPARRNTIFAEEGKKDLVCG